MKRYLGLAVVVLIVATAGCIGGNGGVDDGNVTEENATDGDINQTGTVKGSDVVNETLAAIEGVEAHGFALNQTVESQPLENGTSLRLAEVRVQRHEGIVDISDDELRMEARARSQRGGETATREADFYIVNGVQYTGTVTPKGTKWQVSNNTGGVRRTLSVNNRVELLTERLRNATAEYVRTEEVNGTETYLVEVTPSNPNTYVNDIVEPTEEGPRVVEVEATDVSLSLWVSTETSLPVRMYETIDAQTVDREEVIDAPEAGFRFETLYDAYNYTDENVSIQVPQEALNG